MTPVEVAVDTYIRAVCKSDHETRVALLEQCLAPDIRMVTSGREICGRTEFVGELNRFLSDPNLAQVRVSSAVQAKGKTFRYRAIAEFKNGTSAEAFDAGEIDAKGRIALILTFAGPLPDVPQGSS